MAKKQIRVLIVEDHEPTAYLVRRAFEAKSLNVDWDLCFAQDGAEALDCIFQRGVHVAAALPDFILLDWNLPKVNGNEVLRTLKEYESLRKLPVLIFSASQEEEDVHAAYHGHANSFVTKPSDMEGLCAVVESIESFWIRTARLPGPRRNSESEDRSFRL